MTVVDVAGEAEVVSADFEAVVTTASLSKLCRSPSASADEANARAARPAKTAVARLIR